MIPSACTHNNKLTYTCFISFGSLLNNVNCGLENTQKYKEQSKESSHSEDHSLGKVYFSSLFYMQMRICLFPPPTPVQFELNYK